MSDKGRNMTTKTQAAIETGVVHSKELDTLQAILAVQGESVSYEETVNIGRELLGFFEALGEENEQTEDVSHA